MESSKMKAIYKVTDTRVYGFFDRHRYLSNFHLHPVEYEGIIYPSNENAYHAAKIVPGMSQPTVLYNEEYVLLTRELFTKFTSSEAKSFGRKANLRFDWLNELPQEDQVTDSQGALILQVRDKIMYDLNVSKFQDPNLKAKLLETGELYLEETNWWKDDYWGVFEGKGLNKLGRILMLIRSKLAKKEAA